MSDLKPQQGHPRDDAVEAAALELLAWIDEWRTRHGLTMFEYPYLLHVLLGRQIQGLCLAERQGIIRPTTTPVV